MKIEGNILDYLKTKNLLVYLNIKKSVNENHGDSFSSDENEDGKNSLTIGISKAPLCEVLSVFDKISNIYPVLSCQDTSLTLGFISLELFLDSGYNEEAGEDNSKTKQKKVKSSQLKSSFSEVLSNKKQELLDGRFYFNLKILHLIFTDNFLKKLEKQFGLSPQNKERQIFFMYKIGKTIKKVSHIYDLNEIEYKNFEFINILNVFFNEIIELTFYFSSKGSLIKEISPKM